MNPQIIQPTPEAAQPSNSQSTARPIVYVQQPTTYQPKDLQADPTTRPASEQASPIISRPAAAINSRQRVVIKGSDDETKLLTHGKVEFNAQTPAPQQSSSIWPI